MKGPNGANERTAAEAKMLSTYEALLKGLEVPVDCWVLPGFCLQQVILFSGFLGVLCVFCVFFVFFKCLGLL